MREKSGGGMRTGNPDYSSGDSGILMAG